MSLQILNIDDLVADQFPSFSDNDTVQNHPLAPQHSGGLGSFRCLVSGKSGSGKTNLVISLILSGHITWDHIYLYVKSPEQPKYQLLLKFINSLEKAFERQTGRAVNLCTIASSIEDMVTVDELPDRTNLVIFDDLLTVKHQELIEDYFVRGRHKRADVFYLTQSYHQTPIIIRKNCDYFAVFKPSSNREFNILKADFDMTDNKEEFKKMFTQATTGSNSFLFVDRRTELEILQYRKGFDQYWDRTEQKFIPID